MGNLILILHVLSALLFLGPVTVAVSTFQVRALAGLNGDKAEAGAARNLHNISSTYGMLSLLAPLLGVGMMMTDSAYLKDGRFHASIALCVVAWAVLFFLILPRQKKMLAGLGMLDADEQVEAGDPAKLKSQLSMFGGIFALLWVIVAVLMVI